MHPLFLARLRAYLIDCLGYLSVPAALVPVGLLIHRRYGRLDRRLVLGLSAIPSGHSHTVGGGPGVT